MWSTSSNGLSSPAGAAARDLPIVENAAGRRLRSGAEVNFPYVGVLAYVFGEPVGHDASLLQDDDPLRHLEGDVHVMLDEKDGEVRVEPANDVCHQLRFRHGQPRG